eukprot:SAG31_NODE_6089_length_2175_cov_3.355010_3_plen_350_part_00
MADCVTELVDANQVKTATSELMLLVTRAAALLSSQSEAAVLGLSADSMPTSQTVSVLLRHKVHLIAPRSSSDGTAWTVRIERAASPLVAGLGPTVDALAAIHRNAFDDLGRLAVDAFKDVCLDADHTSLHDIAGQNGHQVADEDEGQEAAPYPSWLAVLAAAYRRSQGATPMEQNQQLLDNLAEFAEFIATLAWGAPTSAVATPPVLSAMETRSVMELLCACDLVDRTRLESGIRMDPQPLPAAERTQRIRKLWAWLLAVPELRKVRRPGQLSVDLVTILAVRPVHAGASQARDGEGLLTIDISLPHGFRCAWFGNKATDSMRGSARGDAARAPSSSSQSQRRPRSPAA